MIGLFHIDLRWVYILLTVSQGSQLHDFNGQDPAHVLYLGCVRKPGRNCQCVHSVRCWAIVDDDFRFIGVWHLGTHTGDSGRCTLRQRGLEEASQRCLGWYVATRLQEQHTSLALVPLCLSC